MEYFVKKGLIRQAPDGTIFTNDTFEEVEAQKRQRLDDEQAA